MSGPFHALGLDFGTNTVRALLVDPADGREAGVGVAPYPHGQDGILSDGSDPNLARQHPDDYPTAMVTAVKEALSRAGAGSGQVSTVLGIGLDATASTPLPVDASSRPLTSQARFSGDLNAHAWLWKDHTAHAEAAEITEAAQRDHPEYLSKCGGNYSSEWYFSKLLHCLRVAPQVMEAADGWVEQGDYIAGLLTGARSPRELKRSTCSASHKAMYHPSWGGLPSLGFLRAVDRRLGDWCQGRLFEKAYTSDHAAGVLCPEWAARLGLPEGIPIAVPAIDAHVGAVGAGIRPGLLVKILGTSACDLVVHPGNDSLPDIPGICGIAIGSILPGYFGLEAGQAAVGDLFHWFVREFGKPAGLSHEDLTAEASRLKPGESGLLALDWNNGNRNILGDPRLSGCLLGQTLQTRPPEVYRALLEATAFGARVIMERFEEYKVSVKEVIVCGGIAAKSPFLLQLYADVTGRPIKISRSAQTCALGAAIFGALVAGRRRCSTEAGGYFTVEEAQVAMTGLQEGVYRPDPERSRVYDELYLLYRLLHDAFGLRGRALELHPVMKKLIELRERARKGDG